MTQAALLSSIPSPASGSIRGASEVILATASSSVARDYVFARTRKAASGSGDKLFSVALTFPNSEVFSEGTSPCTPPQCEPGETRPQAVENRPLLATIFLDRRTLHNDAQFLLPELVQLAASGLPRMLIVIVNDAPLSDHPIGDSVENLVTSRLMPWNLQLTFVRTGIILNHSGGTVFWLKKLSNFRKMIPPQWSACLLSASRFFSILEYERRLLCRPAADAPNWTSIRRISIPGRRTTWQHAFEELLPESQTPFLTRIAISIWWFTGMGHLIPTLLKLIQSFVTNSRESSRPVFSPASWRTLLRFCNRHSVDDIKIAGYNNGINHFGWKFPSQMVLSTSRIPGTIRLSGDCVTVDASVTLKDVMKYLEQKDRELQVIPNYSYICMGTSFFVPIHGSGSEVSTLGDTIESVLLFDRTREEFVFLKRGDEAFRCAMYDRSYPWLLVRLTLRTQKKRHFSMETSVLQDPSAEQVLAMFDNASASHVEIRKSHARQQQINLRIFRPISDASSSLKLPRDHIGRTWDLLEETPVASSLFHWFVRTFAYHVELFMTHEEFQIFWKHHRSLPISKIQLRRVLKDGMANSACRDHDCISADLFMTRRNRDVFTRFISQHLPDVRSNPGKQSL